MECGSWRELFKMGGWLRNVGVMPAKAGIQTWPHVPGLWIPAFAGMTLTSKDLILNDAPAVRLESYRARG